MTIQDLIRTVTSNAARVFDYGVALGTLRTGAEADVSILELRDGDFSFTDSHQENRRGTQRLFSAQTLRSGQIFNPQA
jgi:dihydroorotase